MTNKEWWVPIMIDEEIKRKVNAIWGSEVIRKGAQCCNARRDPSGELSDSKWPTIPGGYL
ncbi:MAG: hypothetical protein NMNS02_11810 [Nitrosomonas sp.]|nr:MAG: hypothetical protein NMNS02_11810 [Nitrosomonas sp.]